MRQHALRLSDELMESVDSARGDVSRNRWLTRLVERAVNRENRPPLPAAAVEAAERGDLGPLREAVGGAVRARSPEPKVEIEEPREAKPPDPSVPGAVRASSLAKRPLDRPIVQKKGGGR